MVRWHPYFSSRAQPSTWLEECQNTVLASGSSNLSSQSLQSPTSGRFRSQSSPWGPPAPGPSAEGPASAASSMPSSSHTSTFTSCFWPVYSTLATTTLWASPSDMAEAMSRGVVSQLVPSFSLPSGSTTLIGTRGISCIMASCFFRASSNTCTRCARKGGCLAGVKAPPRRMPPLFLMLAPPPSIARCFARPPPLFFDGLSPEVSASTVCFTLIPFTSKTENFEVGLTCTALDSSILV
mmetsp:Transcript_14672/g.21591  ORF Transcript_14672/g.21591 Transcript_14672/m.21591 type:complete len:238 (-) Transcript_14672:130-843(-)